MNKVIRLEEDEALDAVQDSRIVAIRWDLVSWSVVLDLDSPISEGDRRMRRMWLLFIGLDEVDIPLTKMRLPTGIWANGPMNVEAAPEGLRDFQIAVLFPRIDERGEVVGARPGDLNIRARRLVAVRSVEAAAPAEYGLSRSARTALATDDELLATIGEVG